MFLRIHKDCLNTLVLLGVLVVFMPVDSLAQRRAPEGRYLQLGADVSPGYGINVAALSVRSVYTRELVVVSDLRSVVQEQDQKARVAALAGVSLRLLGIERLVGYGGYRGYDFDIGLRTGPGLSFSTRDTRVDKNRRFVLLLEPFVRFTSSMYRGRTFYVEAGSVSPYFRFGIWVPI